MFRSFVSFVCVLSLAFPMCALSQQGDVAPSAHAVPVKEARTMTARFASKCPLTTYTTHAGSLSRADVMSLLQQRGSGGVRYMFALQNETHGVQLHLLFDAATSDSALSVGQILSPLGTNTAQKLSRARALEMMKLYRSASLFGEFQKTYGGVMPTRDVMMMFEKTKAESVRFYYAMNAEQQPVAIFTPVAADGRELGDVMLLDYRACPPLCAPGQ